MISLATDGFYSPIAVAYRSSGGADGGVPVRPEIVVTVPSVDAVMLRPSFSAHGAPTLAVLDAASISALRPSLTVTNVRPPAAEVEEEE